MIRATIAPEHDAKPAGLGETDSDTNANKSQNRKVEFLTLNGIPIYSVVLDISYFGLTFEHVNNCRRCYGE